MTRSSELRLSEQIVLREGGLWHWRGKCFKDTNTT